MLFRRAVPIAILIAVSVSGEAAAQVEGTNIDIRFGPNPGEIIFDATELKTVVPTSDTPREFSTEWDLIDFMTGVLNAELIVDDATGELLGFNGTFEILDQPCVSDLGSQTCVPSPNPLKDFLGGAEGKIIIAGEELCIDESKCDFIPISQTFVVRAPMGVMGMATNSSWEDIIEDEANPEPYEIAGESFAEGGAFRVVGTRTAQVSGGYKRMHRVCDWEFFGTYCWDERGWNNLKSETFLTDADGTVMVHRNPAWCGNCLEVSSGVWGLTLSTPLPPSSPWIYKGVYGWHWGEGEEGDMCDGSCDDTGCISGP